MIVITARRIGEYQPRPHQSRGLTKILLVLSQIHALLTQRFSALARSGP